MRVTTPHLINARNAVARANLLGRRTVAGRVVAQARRQRARSAERSGITVTTVTWNSLPFLEVLLQAVRMFGDDRVEILVIDNHSTDGTEEFLARQTDVRSIRTPLNIGHGLGLDLAFARADTSHVVALDVDAFLISQAWLPAVLDPLANGAIVAGAYVQRAFIHPSLLAMRRTDYFRLNLRFVPIGVPTPPGDVPRGIFMDVGEVLGQTVAVVEGTKALHRIPITASRDHNLVGSVYGDVVYHNSYSTQGKPELVHAALAARVEAVAEYLSP